MKRLPSVLEIGHNFANVDITKEPIPVVPTIHYQMGGIPTNIHGQVVAPKDGEPERGGQRPVRGRRMLLRERARRQPPGHQLAARPARVRPRGRQPHRRRRPEVARPTSRCRPTPPTARWRAWPASKSTSAASTRRTSPTTSARRCRSTPACSARRRCSTKASSRSRRCASASSNITLRRQVQGLQHRAHRGAGSGEPDRGRAGHDRVGRRAQGMPRRPRGGRLRGARRLAQATRSAATTSTGSSTRCGSAKTTASTTSRSS